MPWGAERQEMDAKCLAAFGVALELRPVAGSPVVISGIPHLGTAPETLSVTNIQRFWVQYDLLAVKPEQGDMVRFSGQDYALVFVDRQTEGGAYLTLERQR